MAFPSFASEAHAKAFLEEVSIARRLAAETPAEIQQALQARADQLSRGMADIRDVDGSVDDEVRVGISDAFGAQVHGALLLLKSGADLSLGVVGELNPDGSPLKSTAVLYDLSQKTIALQQDLQKGDGAATVSDGLKLVGKMPGAGAVGALGAQAAAMRAADEGRSDDAGRESAEAAGKISGGFFGKTVSLASTAYKAAKGFWTGGSEIVESQQYKGDLQRQGDNVHAQNEQHLAQLSERHGEVIAPLNRMALPSTALTQQFIAQAHAQYPHLTDPAQLDQDRIASGVQEQKALVAEQVRHTADPVAQARLEDYLLESTPAVGQQAGIPAEFPETAQNTHEPALAQPLAPTEAIEPAEPARTAPDVADAPVSHLPDATQWPPVAPDSTTLAEYSAAPRPADEGERAVPEPQAAVGEVFTDEFSTSDSQAAGWQDGPDGGPARASEEAAEPSQVIYPANEWASAEHSPLAGYESANLPATPEPDLDAAPGSTGYESELAANALANADGAEGEYEALNQASPYSTAEEAPAELDTVPAETAVGEFAETTTAADQWPMDTPEDASSFPVPPEQEDASQQPLANYATATDELVDEETVTEQEAADEAVTDEPATDEEPAQAADESATEMEENLIEEELALEEEPTLKATEEAPGEEPEPLVDEVPAEELAPQQENTDAPAGSESTAPAPLTDELVTDELEEPASEEPLPVESTAREELAAASTTPTTTATAATQPAGPATATAGMPGAVANGTTDGPGTSATAAPASAAAGAASASRRDGSPGAPVSPLGYSIPGPMASTSFPDNAAAATAAAAPTSAGLPAPAGNEAWSLQDAMALTPPDPTALLKQTEEEAPADAVHPPNTEAEPAGAAADGASDVEPSAGYEQGYEPDAADPAEGYTSYEGDATGANAIGSDAAAEAIAPATAYGSNFDDAEESAGPADDYSDSSYGSSYPDSNHLSSGEDPSSEYANNDNAGNTSLPSNDDLLSMDTSAEDASSSDGLSSAYASSEDTSSEDTSSENYPSSGYSDGFSTSDDAGSAHSAYADGSDGTGSTYAGYDSSTHADYASSDNTSGHDYLPGSDLGEVSEADAYDSGADGPAESGSDPSLDNDSTQGNDFPQSESSGSSDSSVTTQ